jgi:hypothetical protein
MIEPHRTGSAQSNLLGTTPFAATSGKEITTAGEIGLSS